MFVVQLDAGQTYQVRVDLALAPVTQRVDIGGQAEEAEPKDRQDFSGFQLNVLPLPIESPTDGARALLVDPHDVGLSGLRIVDPMNINPKIMAQTAELIARRRSTRVGSD